MARSFCLARRAQGAHEHQMIDRLIKLACVAVLCVTLSLGLWPFRVPRNEVSWLSHRNGLYFGRYSTVFSAPSFRTTAPLLSPLSASLEVWLQPRRIWDFSTFLAFYDPGSLVRFSVGQAQKGILLQCTIQDRRRRTEVERLLVTSAFREDGPSFITITSGARGITVYIEGVRARTDPAFRLPPQALDGQLILGDSPEQGDSWTGKLLGVSIYRRELSSAQVTKHFETWTRQGRPQIAQDEDNEALYLFDHPSGHIVQSNSGSRFDLSIPEDYTVLGHLLLESPWSEFRRANDYGGAVAKNIVGFVPLGCCFYAYFSFVRQSKRAAFKTVILGLGVSLTIELLQWLLPMRDSGTTDLLTNTLGTWLGVWLWNVGAVQWKPLNHTEGL